MLWELRDGPVGARRLLAVCDGLSSSVLYDRLCELQDAGLVCQADDGGYALTDQGASLRSALEPLDGWARQWERRLR